MQCGCDRLINGAGTSTTHLCVKEENGVNYCSAGNSGNIESCPSDMTICNQNGLGGGHPAGCALIAGGTDSKMRFNLWCYELPVWRGCESYYSRNPNTGRVNICYSTRTSGMCSAMPGNPGLNCPATNNNVCLDARSAAKCQRFRNKGRCTRARAMRKCRFTCGLC